MKILLFGSNGYIGSEFVSQLLPLTNIQFIRLLPSRKSDGGGYSFKELDSLIKGIKPTVIINCAAYVGGNSIVNCEDHKDQAIQSNVIFPQMLGEICQERNIIFGHLSSGCVFNGYPTDGYEEDDAERSPFDILKFTTPMDGSKRFHGYKDGKEVMDWINHPYDEDFGGLYGETLAFDHPQDVEQPYKTVDISDHEVAKEINQNQKEQKKK